MLDHFGVTEANWREAAKTEPDFAFSETPRYVGRAVAALAADPQVGRRSGLALLGADVAEDYGLTDVDGSRPHFWRNMEAWLARELAAPGELPPRTHWVLSARYAQIHPAPAKAELARLYEGKLGFEELGAGLRPYDA